MNKTIVKINDTYQIEIDDLNHTLMKFTEGGEVISRGKYEGQITKDKWSVVGHYPNIQHCLRKVAQLSTLDGSTVSVEEYIKKLDKLLGEIK